MSDGVYLQAYLNLGNDWLLSLTSNDAQKDDPMFTSIHLFAIYFPEKAHHEFMAWRHHRLFNQWQDDVYSMRDDQFEFFWPLIAGALCEQGAES